MEKNRNPRIAGHWTAKEDRDKLIRKQERERVFDELEDWLFSEEGGGGHYNKDLKLYGFPAKFDILGLIHKIAELRAGDPDANQ